MPKPHPHPREENPDETTAEIPRLAETTAEITSPPTTELMGPVTEMIANSTMEARPAIEAPHTPTAADPHPPILPAATNTPATTPVRATRKAITRKGKAKSQQGVKTVGTTTNSMTTALNRATVQIRKGVKTGLPEPTTLGVNAAYPDRVYVEWELEHLLEWATRFMTDGGRLRVLEPMVVEGEVVSVGQVTLTARHGNVDWALRTPRPQQRAITAGGHA